MRKTFSIARVRGICGGVRRALDLLRGELASGQRPVFLLHDIVHNSHVMNELRASGVRVAAAPDAVPPNAVVLLSAHGTPSSVKAALDQRGVAVLDAVCPIVAENHRKLARAEADGKTVVVCGWNGHAEVEALLSVAARPFCVETVADVEALPPELNTRPIAAISQTTLELAAEQSLKSALKARFPNFTDLGGVCDATRARQTALKELCTTADFAVVIGSDASSNSRKLVEAAENAGVAAALIDDPAALAEMPQIAAAHRIALTAGASVPDELVERAARELIRMGFHEDKL